MKIQALNIKEGMTIKVSCLHDCESLYPRQKSVGCGSIRKNSPSFTVNIIMQESISQGSSLNIKNTFKTFILNTSIGVVRLSSRMKVEVL